MLCLPIAYVVFSFCHQFLEFSEYRSFTSFIPRYFMLFDAIVKGVIFLISLFDSLLLKYRNTTSFCILILYPATLLNSLLVLIVIEVFRLFYI